MQVQMAPESTPAQTVQVSQYRACSLNVTSRGPNRERQESLYRSKSCSAGCGSSKVDAVNRALLLTCDIGLPVVADRPSHSP